MLIKSFTKIDPIALDYETNEDASGKYHKDIEIFSLAGRDKSGKLIAESFDKSKVPQLARALKDKTVIAHNMKFERTVSENNKIKVPKMDDTLIMAHLLGITQGKDLKTLRKTVLKKKERAKYKDVNKADTKEFMQYNKMDSIDCYQLYEKFNPLITEHNLETVYELERKVVEPIREMEATGVLIDLELRQKQEIMLENYVDDIQVRIDTSAGKEINLGSTKQLQELFQRIYKINPRPHWVTKTGFSTNIKVLEEIQEIYTAKAKRKKKYKVVVDSITDIINSRKYNKLLSSFVGKKVTNKIYKGRFYASFNALGTVSGRFSCNNPNLQQIPKAEFVKGDMETHIRSLFIAPPGWVMITADYSQIELVLMAELSQDKLMRQAFLDGLDLHQLTADLVGGNCTRSHGKTLNFAVGYGISPVGYAAQADVDQRTAVNHINMFFKKYSGLARKMDTVHRQARTNGFVKTISGRKRFFPELSKNPDRWVFGKVDRQSFNTYIQGSAADLMKLAMIKTFEKLNHRKAKMCMTVHDEVSVYAKLEYAEEAYHIIKYEMENAIKCTIPVKAAVAIGKRWSDNK